MAVDRAAPKDAITDGQAAADERRGLSPPNFTQVPNEFFAMLPSLGDKEVRVMLVIIRKLAGWHKESDEISIAQIARECGACKASVVKSVQSLESRGLINKSRNEDGKKGHVASTYTLNWKPDPYLNNRQGGSPNNRQALVQNLDKALVQNLDTQKKGLQKKQEQKKELLRSSTGDEEIVASTVRRAGQALHVSLDENDVALLTARIKYFLGKKPDPDYVVSVAEECHAEYQRKGRKVNDWVKLYLSFLASRLEDAEISTNGTSRNGHSEPPPASPPTGTAFYDDALVPWLRHLSSSGALPARTVKDDSFEALRVVSFDGETLVLSKPENFHPYNARAWPVTMQRVADERLGREITVTWQEESDGPISEPDQASTSSNGHRPRTEADRVVEQHRGR